MANPKTLKPFTKDHRPAKGSNSRKGIPNRATVFKNLLEMKVDVADPEKGGKKKVTLYEAAALGQIQSAMKGNTRAFQEIQDSLFGKQTIKLDLKPEELKELSDQELDDLISQLTGR